MAKKDTTEIKFPKGHELGNEIVISRGDTPTTIAVNGDKATVPNEWVADILGLVPGALVESEAPAQTDK